MRRRASRNEPSWPGRVAVLVVSVAALTCAGEDPGEQVGVAAQGTQGAPNVLLVTIETLRADHVSAYGYGRRTTPFLDSLAAEGLLFENAHATSSWTLPSLSSLLTSTYASEHGVGSRGPAAGKTLALPEHLTLLPELLSARGYRTYGVTASLQTTEKMGYARGFDRYSNLGSVDCRRVSAKVEAWLPELHRDGEWFLWLHLFDPHGPYHPREPALSEFWPPQRERRTDLDSALSQQLFNRRDELDEEDLAYLEALYDSEIRHADDCLAGIYETLPRPEELLLVVTSDHGEEFMERGRLLHSQTLFDESIRVPLVVRPPGGTGGRRIDRPASLIDVAPTILAAAGAEVPAALRGQTLLPGDDRKSEGRPVYAELLTRTNLRTVSDGRWKLMRESGRSRLYDLRNDPGEGIDQAANRPAELKRLLSSLDEFERLNNTRALAGAEVSRSPEELEALRALGYIN